MTDEITERAIAEINRETKIRSITGKISGTWHCSLQKTNKTFLRRTISQTLNHNRRENDRHQSKSRSKLEQLDRRPSRTFIRRRRSPEKRDFDEIKHYRRLNDRYLNRRRDPIKFVKPRDLDERVLIPGKPKEAKVKKISFIAPYDSKDKYLGHDGKDHDMEKIRQKIGIENILNKIFVPPENEEDKIFHLSQNKVAGVIRSVDD